MVSLTSECACEYGDKIYFISDGMGIIFSFDLITKQFNIEAKIPEEKFFQERLFGNLLKWNDKFVLVPLNAENIWITDLGFTDWEKIELDNPSEWYKFFTGFIVDDCLYLLKHYYKHSICINLIDKSKREFDTPEDDYYLSVCNINNIVISPSCNSNRVFVFDKDTKEEKAYEVGKGSYNAAAYIDGKVYLAPRDREYLTAWKETQIEENEIGRCHALGIFKYKNEIFIPSYIAGQSVYVDAEGKVFPWNDKDRYVLATKLDEGKYVLMTDKAEMKLYDIRKENCDEYRCLVEDDEIINYINKGTDIKDGIINENKLNLETYLSVL